MIFEQCARGYMRARLKNANEMPIW